MAYVAKFDARGNRQWLTAPQASGTVEVRGMDVDDSGNTYLVGTFNGSFGEIDPVERGAYLAKIDHGGTLDWVSHLGREMRAVDVTETGGVFVAGRSNGDLTPGPPDRGSPKGFVAKFDTDGNQKWATYASQDPDLRPWHVTADASGNAYLAGDTPKAVDGMKPNGPYDAVVVKFDPDGNRQWVRVFGSDKADRITAVEFDEPNHVYVAGSTKTGFAGKTYAGGNWDGLMAKFDTDGNRQWLRLFGTSEWDYTNDLEVDSAGNLYVSGDTTGDLAGQSNNGGNDAFVLNYDAAGQRQWGLLLGTSEKEKGMGVRLDDSGNFYTAGETWGDLNGQVHAGRGDAFLVKFGR